MRRVLGILLGLALVAALAGCDISGGPKPDAAADALARALTKRDVGALSFSGATGAAAQRDLARVLARMSSVPATVRAVDVTSEGDDASAVLVWTWRTAGHPWTTRSPLALRKRDGTWRPVWEVKLIHSSLRAGYSLRATGLRPTRGDIFGANGRRLVTDRAVLIYGLDKTGLSSSEAVASARALARLVGVDAKAYAARVRAAGPSSYVEALTLRREDPQPAQSKVTAIQGARTTPAKLPLAASRGFATALLGRVGAPTAEMVARSTGTLSATDQVGIGGLEARYESLLSGTAGVRVSLVDPSGNGTPLHRVEPVAGKPLVTSLDVNLQQMAQDVLDRIGPASALVAIRPSTGAIVAAANGPGAKALNVATYGRYAPGSTFKLISSLALLRAGLTPSSTVDCRPSVTVDGKRFENYDDYPPSALGRIPLVTAIANSCNTAVIGERGKIRGTALADAAAALGLGVDHDLGFPAYFGQVPAPGSETEGAADLIGQGKVLASPLVMATVMASIGAGTTVVPWLLEDHRATASTAKPLTKAEAHQLKVLTRAVVTRGSGRLLDGLPGAPAYAKTGTAEYGSSSPPRTHAWMVALHGDLAVAVFVADGATGSGTAGPILKRFLQQVG